MAPIQTIQRSGIWPSVNANRGAAIGLTVSNFAILLALGCASARIANFAESHRVAPTLSKGRIT